MAGESVVCYSPIFGCDPEFFFAKGKEVIGSEKVLPKDGALAAYCAATGRGATHHSNTNKHAFVQDGVQVELNPNPHGCRANLGNELQAAFKALKAHLETVDGVTVSFTSVVRIDPKELESLSEKSKVFGCLPSTNFYDSEASVKVDAAKYLKRSAGGHIHLGLGAKLLAEVHKDPKKSRLAPLMDVLVGNTCVLIDRDPKAIERRKNYGRAGEYRLPKHGFEYRTLSNFWLRSYQLMSFVMGLSRLATSVLGTTIGVSQGAYGGETMDKHEKWDAESALLDGLNLQQVAKAINKNDFNLATQNYKQVRKFIQTHVKTRLDDGCGLEAGLLDKFDIFVDVVGKQGIKHWFKQDPLTHWCTIQEGHGTGWESFLTTKVKAT